MIPLLEKYRQDPVPEVAETCELALDRFRWLESNDKAKDLLKNPYSSIDPAPPAETTDVNVLRADLLDESKSLFDRYRAMFTLRNLGTTESILALTEGMCISFKKLRKILISSTNYQLSAVFTHRFEGR